MSYSKDAFRFCPFCGSGNFVWDGVKSHACSDCGKKLYTNEVGAVIALIYNADGELLLTTRKFNPAKGMLDLPGGFIDLGETAEQAVVREIKEELNLKVENLQFYGSFPNEYVYAGLTYFTIDIAFVCKVENFDGLSASDDVSDICFKNPKQVNLQEIGLASVRNLIHQLQTKTLL
ncbi:MAG: NUDIX domain-containing protein [Lentimicrobiaceae bacterium]|nr:NUDIX domain-containing protein [Lentimicrobiaceae bacterium]